MNAICPNCKAKLSCGCQKRTASNGAGVCTTCLPAYEASLRIAPLPGTAPTNVTVLYKGPGK